MSKFDTMLEKVFSNLLEEDNTGLVPTSSNLRDDSTAYDSTVVIIKELIRSGLMKPVNIKEIIIGDDINKGFYFTWDFKNLAYVIRVMPSSSAGTEVTITNLKDQAEVKRIEQHEEVTVNEIIDYLNNARKVEEENNGKPTQTSEQPTALPGGTAPTDTSVLPGTSSATSDYIKGLK